MGNCYRRGVNTLVSRDQNRAGYGAFADVACTNAGVQLALAVSYGRHLDLLDVVVQAGTLQAGDEVQITMGAPDGNLLQAQKFAQTAVFSIGVDVDGNGAYRQIANFPAVKVVGAGEADRFRVFAPAVVQPGESFDVRVLPVDIYSFNPATRLCRRGTPVRAGGGGDSRPHRIRHYGAALGTDPCRHRQDKRRTHAQCFRFP